MKSQLMYLAALGYSAALTAWLCYARICGASFV